MTKNLLDLLFGPSLAVLHRRLPFLLFLLVAAVPAGALAQPNLDSLSEATLDRSGRLRLLGTGFGAEQGASEVLIDGLAAIVAEWSDQAVNAYVPEAAGPGMVEVRIVTDIGTSNALPLDVTLRQPQGRVRWRFTCDSRGVRQRPGIGPDGTVYAQDTSGIVYAIAPDGALLWLLDTGDEGSEGPVVVGDDGTIYVSTNPLGPDLEVHAISPSGSIQWTFTDSGSQGIIAGPGIGPDDNIYGVTDFGGAGAFALSPQGDLLWSHPGDPEFWETGQLGTEIAFGTDRFYVAFDEGPVNPVSLFYGMSLDGSQEFAEPRPDDNAQPVVGPNGDVYLQVWSPSAGRGLGAYDPFGSLLWVALSGQTNVLTSPDVAPDGRIFAVRNLRELREVRPDGSEGWIWTDDHSLQAPIVSPDGSLLLAGLVEPMQFAGVKAFATSGQPLWEEIFPNEGGNVVFASARPIFEPGGATAYVAAEPITNPEGNLHCYVYALATGDSVVFGDGFEAGDTSGWSLTLP